MMGVNEAYDIGLVGLPWLAGCPIQLGRRY